MMRHSIIVLAFFCFGLFACENEETSNAPEAVMSAFNQKFPNAENVEWEQKDDNIWEAEFDLDGDEVEAEFSGSGEWMETETEIENSELPELISNTVKENYPDHNIDEASYIFRPDFDGYKVEIENGQEELAVLLTVEGEIVEVEKEIDDD